MPNTSDPQRKTPTPAQAQLLAQQRAREYARKEKEAQQKAERDQRAAERQRREAEQAQAQQAQEEQSPPPTASPRGAQGEVLDPVRQQQFEIAFPDIAQLRAGRRSKLTARTPPRVDPTGLARNPVIKEEPEEPEEPLEPEATGDAPSPVPSPVPSQPGTPEENPPSPDPPFQDAPDTPPPPAGDRGSSESESDEEEDDFKDATMPETRQAEAARLVATIQSIAATITRFDAQCTVLLEAVDRKRESNTVDNFVVREVERKVRMLEVHDEKLTQAVQDLEILEAMNDETMQLAENTFKHIKEIFQKLWDAQTALAATDAAGGRNGQDGGGPSPSKPNTALTPAILTFEMSPIEFQFWSNRFASFFNTSKLHQLNAQDQREYFVSYVDQVVYNTVLGEMKSQFEKQYLPLLEVTVQDDANEDVVLPSLINILDNIWLSKYPLFKRRQTYFEMEFNGKMRDLPNMIQDMRRASEVAGLDEMNKDTLTVYLVLRQVKDDVFRRMCWAEPDLTIDKFQDIANRRVREIDCSARYKQAKQIPAFKAQAQNEIVCWGCKKPGHTRRFCPAEKRPRAQEAFEQTLSDVSSEDESNLETANKAGKKQAKKKRVTRTGGKRGYQKTRAAQEEGYETGSSYPPSYSSYAPPSLSEH